jgi:hypothetical protein
MRLFITSIFLFCGLTTILSRAQSTGATVAEQYLLAAANQDRAAQQLPPLHLDEHLALAARLHAYEMVKRGAISHQFDGERGLADRAADAGAHFSLVTENVAQAPNSAQIHDLWMRSAGHRANLLDPNVDAVGIAVIWSKGEFYAVEDFAHSVQRLTLDQQEGAVGQLLARSGLELLPKGEDARQTCQLSTGYAGDRKPWFVMRFTSSELTRLPDELKAKIATGRFRAAAVGACVPEHQSAFTSYSVAVMLYP